MQEIVGALIVGIFIGICLGYGVLYRDLKKYSKNISILQDEVNYYRRNENIK